MTSYPEASSTIALSRLRSLDGRDFGPLGRLGRWTAGHVRTVALAWVAVAVLLGAFAPRRPTGAESGRVRTIRGASDDPRRLDRGPGRSHSPTDSLRVLRRRPRRPTRLRARQGHRVREDPASQRNPTPRSDPRVDARGRAGVRTTFARGVVLLDNRGKGQRESPT